jgi:hypothetical protein
MTLRISAGWDFAKALVGSFSMTITGSSGAAFAVNVTSGTYAHETMAPVNAYTGFAAALQTAINAAATAGTYTVSYNSTTQVYTITRDTGTFTATLNTVARRVLGRDSDWSVGAISQTSNIRPYYVVLGAMGARSMVKLDHEPDGIVEAQESDSGEVYSVTRTTAPTYDEWTIEYESKAATFSHAAAAGVPWTWEHFIKHCRSEEPFKVVDDLGSSVHKMRAEAARFKPTRVKQDYDNHWHIPFLTYLQGRL